MGIFVYDAETETELGEVGQGEEGEVLCRNRNVNSSSSSGAADSHIPEAAVYKQSIQRSWNESSERVYVIGDSRKRLRFSL